VLRLPDMPSWLRSRKPPQGQRRLFLHIGMNKAGSSAIQRTLAAREALLRKAGLLYPRTGRSGSEAHHLLSHVLGFSQGKPPRVKSPAELRDLGPKLLHECERRGCHTVILSSEVFTNRGDIAGVRDFLAGWDVRIVVYLRRHDHWWASSYSQGVRMTPNPPWPPGFDGYIAWQRARAHKGDYRKLLDDWAAVFGAERMLVRPYEREQNQPSIVADLLQTIGFPELARSVGAEVDAFNVSLGEREIALIDAIQHTDLPHVARKRLINAIAARPGQVKGGGFISPAERLRMVEENSESYAFIARTYLGRPDGVLFREALPDASLPWTPPPPASAQEIIESLAAIAGWR
jgi:hypothetical protein